jgi:hypothetical protein
VGGMTPPIPAAEGRPWCGIRLIPAVSDETNPVVDGRAKTLRSPAADTPKIEADCARRPSRPGSVGRQITVRGRTASSTLPTQQRRRCFLSLHFLFKDLTQYQE